MDFKLDYSWFSHCFGESLVQKTAETMNISSIATYANYTARTDCRTHCSRVSCCRDETTKCLNWFLLDSFKANNCFLPEGKNSQPPCKSFSYRLVRPFYSFLTMGGVTCASLVRFTLRQVGSFVQNYLFARIHSTQKFLLLELLWVKRSAWDFFRWGSNRKQVCFKIQNGTVGKDVTEYKNCAL